MIATLDTCVLLPSLQRDFLLSLAIEQIYRPTWNSAILAELEFHEARKFRTLGVPIGKATERAHGPVRPVRPALSSADTSRRI